MKSKKCSKCNQVKAFSKFYKNLRSKDGLKSQCRKCHNEYSKNWRIRNKEKMAKYKVEYRKKSAEKIRNYRKKYKKFNKEKMAKTQKTWVNNNYEAYRKAQRKWQKMKRKTDPKYRCDMNMASAIWLALREKKNGEKWEYLVGYTLQELMWHLETQFNKKMSWDNYGSYWHIDHIKPKNRYVYNNPEDEGFKRCWALENLQPLEARENLVKR